jgi:FOG: GAF domain
MTSCLENVERMAALQATGLLDAPTRPDLDRLTTEAAERLGAPFALMTLVDDHRQFFASAYGLPPEVCETPLEYSWCKFVAAFDAPFRVDNSLTHPLVRDSHGTKEAGVRCYLGVPLRTKEGQALGSFCVGDISPRQWGPDEQRILEDLAQKAMELAESGEAR